MSLQESSFIDQIEVNSICAINVRRADVITKDGKEISRMYHRHSLVPGSDLTGEDAKVVAIAQAVWTPEVIAAYQASLQNAQV